MKINHDVTRTKISEICNILKGQASEVDKYKAEYQQTIDNDVYTQEAKNKQLEELRVSYTSKLNEAKQKIESAFEVIREAEAENEKILELDVPEYTNTLLSICALRGGCPSVESMELILKTFAGQKQLLILLTASLDYAKDSDIYKTISTYTADIDRALFPLINQAQNLELSPDKAKYSLYRLYNSAIEFGEIHGIKFSETEKDPGLDANEMQASLTRAAMGL